MPWTPPPGGVDDEQMKIDGSEVAIELGRGPEKKLREIRRAAADIATDQIRIARLELLRREDAARKINRRKPGANRSICFSITSVQSTVDPLGTWQ